MTIPEYTPAGCAPITLVTQALSHFNYSLSSGPTTIHCTVFIIYVVYNVFYLSLWLHCDMILNFNDHTNALTVIYLLIYLFFTCRIFLVICTMHCFIYFTLWCTLLTAFLYWYQCIQNLCYLFVSSIIKQYICTFSCLVFLFFVTWKYCDLTIHY